MKHKTYKPGDSFHYEVLKDYPELQPMCMSYMDGELLPKIECLNKVYGFDKVQMGDLFTVEILHEWLDYLENQGIIEAT